MLSFVLLFSNMHSFIVSLLLVCCSRVRVCQVDDDAVHGVEPQGYSPRPASSFEEDGEKVVRQDVDVGDVDG